MTQGAKASPVDTAMDLPDVDPSEQQGGFDEGPRHSRIKS